MKVPTLRASEVEKKMNMVCVRLNIPLRVVWSPNKDAESRGRIVGKNVFIRDQREEEAWTTFIHELLEWRLRPLLSHYRGLVNVLIEFIDKMAYREKEKFLDGLPQVLKATEEMTGGD